MFSASRPYRLAFSAAMGLLAAGASADLTNHWTFDGTANDTIGGAAGVVHGAASYVDGVHGQALDFDGATYLTTNYTPQLASGDSMSIAVWVRLPAGGVSGIREVCGLERSNHQEIRLFVNGDNGTIVASYRDDNWDSNAAVGNLAMISDGQWHHLASIRDKGTGQIRLYVDGLEQTPGPDTGGPVNLTEPRTMDIGADNNSTFGHINPWRGSLDDLRFYDHALSQQEIDELAGLSDADPAHYWPLDGNTNDVAGGMTGTVRDGSPAYADGIRGLAFAFNGTRYISTDYVPQLGEDDSMTMSAWIRLDPAAVGVHSIVGLERSNHQEIKLLINRDSGLIGASFRDDDWVSNSAFAPDSLVTDNRWHHIVGVRDADSGEVYLYVDGRRSACVTDVGTVCNVTEPRSIDLGADNNSTRGHIERFIGLVDEIRFYNRALSYDEILALYAEDACPADFNGDGAVNTLDVLNFLNAWSDGCP